MSHCLTVPTATAARLVVRKPENSRGDTAESDAFKAHFLCEVQAGNIASPQHAPVLVGHFAPDHRSYGMDDIFRRQIIRARDLGAAGRLLFALRAHDLGTVQTHLDARPRVDDVVDTLVVGNETAEQPIVGGVHHRVRVQTSDIALPERDPVAAGNVRYVDDAVFQRFRPEQFILDFQKTRAHGIGQTLVEDSPR